jgi:hypothetical protein
MKKTGKPSRLLNVHQSSEHYNKRMSLTTFLPKIERSLGDVMIIAKSTDRLDLLAHKYYGQQSLWWILVLANNLPGDSFFIIPGTQLFIPKNFSKIQNDINKLNRD